MSTENRLNNAFKHALELPLTSESRYVLMSDCHRGVGNSSDNFLKNRHIFLAALKYYYQNHFTYIELGDGDELWENRNLSTIIEMHGDIFRLFSHFHKENRLYMLYGNHDIVKRNKKYVKKKCTSFYCIEKQAAMPLLPDFTFHESIILRPTDASGSALYLTHGHQASLINSTFWPVAQFMVRYIWQSLESIGISDPTSAAKNYRVKTKTEENLSRWAAGNRHILITGHTHRPLLTKDSPFYMNTGCCIHPYCITCIEIENGKLTLVKWCISSKADEMLCVSRSVLAGPHVVLP